MIPAMRRSLGVFAKQGVPPRPVVSITGVSGILGQPHPERARQQNNHKNVLISPFYF
jgi:hypothetical protein